MIWLLAYLMGGSLTVYVIWRLPAVDDEPMPVGIAIGLLFIWPLLAVGSLVNWIGSMKLPPAPQVRAKEKRLSPEIQKALSEVEGWTKR